MARMSDYEEFVEEHGGDWLSWRPGDQEEWVAESRGVKFDLQRYAKIEDVYLTTEIRVRRTRGGITEERFVPIGTLSQEVSTWFFAAHRKEVKIDDRKVKCGSMVVGFGDHGVLPYALSDDTDEISLEDAEDLILALRTAIDERKRRSEAAWNSLSPEQKEHCREMDRMNLMGDGSGGTFRGIEP